MAATQQQVASASDKTVAESVRIQRRLSMLTGVLAFVGFLQAIAIGWPYLSWWLGLHDLNFVGQFEVREREQIEAPNYEAAGTHTEVNYVLVLDGHRVYANCDKSSIGPLDPDATCGFRPLRKYSCRVGQQRGDKALSDLLWKGAEGHNVYLYVTKKE